MKRLIITIILFISIACVSCNGASHSTTSPVLSPSASTSIVVSSVSELTPSSSSVSPSSIVINETTTIPSSVLEVHFIDVGEGDCILVDYGSTDILIDGGQYSGVVNSIKPYVHGDIEAVIATHPHADHIGGLTSVLLSYKVDEVYWTGETDTTQTFINWKKAMDSSGAKETIVKRGDVIREGILNLDVLDPLVISDSDVDQDCIVLSFQFGSQSFLFMADDGKPAEDDLLSAGLLHHFDVLKVGHHGSDTSSSQEFLDVVKPEIAVYECSLTNQYGFPIPSIISRLNASGAKIYGTDKNGTVTYETNGVFGTVTTAKP